jgi:hypothetical protein
LAANSIGVGSNAELVALLNETCRH